jgi:hypothetical protein
LTEKTQGKFVVKYWKVEKVHLSSVRQFMGYKSLKLADEIKKKIK